MTKPVQTTKYPLSYFGVNPQGPAAPATVQPRPALITFGNRWELDGDYIRCRSCGRPQIVSMALHDFQHAAECPGAEHERNPWKTLSSLISAQVANAKEPADAE